jgi:hypothetical protein
VLYLGSCFGERTIGAATLGAGLPASCRMASVGSPSHDSKSSVGVGTIGLRSLDFELSASCRIASLRSSSLYSECCFGFGTIGVKRSAPGFQVHIVRRKLFYISFSWVSLCNAGLECEKEMLSTTSPRSALGC